jgi:hypothetical protein
MKAFTISFVLMLVAFGCGGNAESSKPMRSGEPEICRQTHLVPQKQQCIARVVGKIPWMGEKIRYCPYYVCTKGNVATSQFLNTSLCQAWSRCNPVGSW